MRTPCALGLGLLLLAAGGWARGQEVTGPELRDLFLRLDANNDTVLERDEIPDGGRAAFETLLKLGDSDKDGRLQAAEMRDLARKAIAGVGGPQALGQRFRAADKDGDGKLSRAEFPGRAPMFDRLDADGDGYLTRQEAARFARQRQAQKSGQVPGNTKPGEARAATSKP